MKHILKQIVFGLLWILRPVFPKRSGITILMYHGVDDSGWEFSVRPKIFEKQIRYLQEHQYVFLTLDQVKDALDGKMTMPNRSVVITFDDGYESVAKNALPILDTYHIPAELFVHSDRSQKELGNTLDLLSWDKIKNLQSRGFVIQSHSATHQNFKTLSRDQIRQEFDVVEGDFQGHLGHKPAFFAYPGGKYSMNIIRELQFRGYRGACTINRGRVEIGDDPFQLKRNGIGQCTSWLEFLVRTSHVNDSYEWLINLAK